MRKGTLIAVFIAVAVIAILVASSSMDRPGKDAEDRITVIASIFPVFDFARKVAGERADVYMLLPPCAEAHSYEPKPSDVGLLSEADLFIYTTSSMEPWAPDMLAGMDSSSLHVLEAGLGAPVSITYEEEHALHEDGRVEDGIESKSGRGVDPHIWLDIDNSIFMVRAIASAMAGISPGDADYFHSNAEAYVERLIALDNSYKEAIAGCSLRTIIHGGHYAFGYLARRYGLDYRAAQGFSPDSEPGPKQMMELIGLMKDTGAKYIFYEELVEPRVADVIAKETGAGMLMLHAGHNISKGELASGKGFIGLMEDNLEALKVGLGYDGN
ncbi:MAG TPA: zinc ABC transporter substrate-binding protein [Bacillota bacterium]|nr:zinc ABC transporter substrate-binding protein [Bacillota bacterium]HOG52651.1 zinc ABC transporter substrate-binding protein [Bacillota bacterium]